MIDATLITIIPPIVASILAYLVAVKRAKISHAKNITDIQIKALDIVIKSEERMRDELKKDVDELRLKNEELQKEITLLRNQLVEKSSYIEIMKGEILSLQSTIALYKNQIEVLQNYEKLGCPNYPDCPIRIATLDALSKVKNNEKIV